MNQDEIIKRRQTIDSFLDKWYNECKALRSICTHPEVIITYKCNTGNYDPGADSSWSIHKCPDCDKRWTEDED
jgi:hypothetical protein